MGLPSAVLLRTQSDERLVALARDGHERAFEAIVRRYRRPLLGACQRICADGRGEDVLQQALLSAWAGLRRGDDVRDLRAWLYRIVRNAAVSHRRRSGHDGLELVDTLSLAPSPAEEAERRAVVQDTLAAIAELPDRQREALLRIAVQGRSQDEVAGELGLSAVAVRQLVHRARTALRGAATAVVPLPVVSWAASVGAGDGDLAPRVAGLVAGAGGTGASAALLKAGAVAGVAATAVSAPLLAHHGATAPAAAIAPPASTPRPTPAPRPIARAAPRPVASPAPHRAAAVREEGAPHRGGSGGRHQRGRSGGGKGGDDDERNRAGARSGGSGGGGDEHRGGDDGDDSHRGGDDGHRAAAPVPTAAAILTAVPTTTDGDGGSGSGHDGGGSGGGDGGSGGDDDGSGGD